MKVNKRVDPEPVTGRFHGIFAHAVENKAGTRMLHLSGQVGVPPEGPTPTDWFIEIDVVAAASS